VARFPVLPHWPRYVGIDFGGLNTAALFYAEEPETGVYYAYHLYYPQHKKTAEAHVKEILLGEPPLTAVSGASSEDQ
jgi:hypothetical protein